ncbi:MAG: hypothetical protein NTY53_21845 [Kiritimatiellaeota bacterium]|nr:hypothetical protein [Kiritimatiellota bacterium]
MKPFISKAGLLGCAGLVLSSVSLAADTPNTPPSVTEQTLRDPFSPLTGPAKPASTNLVATPQLPVPPDVKVPSTDDPAVALSAALHVQGFLQQGTRRYAMVNDRLVSAGDILQVRQGTLTARFRVRSVGTTKVEFDLVP